MKSVDNPRQLHVLYVSDAGPRVQALAEVLRNRGHRVTFAQSVREILLAAESHVLVLDVAERSEEHALMLLEEIQHAGVELPVVMVSESRSYELCRSAAEHGVPALIQDAFDPTALANAVEHCADDHSPDAPARIGHSEQHNSDASGSHAALDGLRTYLEEARLAPAHSARVLVAAAEIIDNVGRHAYTSAGELRVEADLNNAHLWLSISDQGCGLNQATAKLDSMASLLPTPRRAMPISQGASIVFGGLSRASRLADRFDTHSDQEGSVVELEFELSPVACCADALPELVNLMPHSMRALIRSVESKKRSLEELSPILALTVQRLVGPESGQRHALKKV